MTNIMPTGYRVLVAPDEVEKVSKGGIVVVTDQEEKRHQAGQMFGTIVKVGPTAWSESKDIRGTPQPWAEVGHRIMYSKYAGKTIYDAELDKNFILINDEDVLAIVPLKVEDNPIDGEVTL